MICRTDSQVGAPLARRGTALCLHAASRGVALHRESADPEIGESEAPSTVVLRALCRSRYLRPHSDSSIAMLFSSLCRLQQRHKALHWQGANGDMVSDYGFVYSKKFTKAGTYPYKCHNHGDQMYGIVTVVPQKGEGCHCSVVTVALSP